jgi:short-subunit dehydrogenase
VKTAFQEHVIAGKAPESVIRGRRFAIEARECAEDIRRGIERDARTVVTPRAGWLLAAASRFLPAQVEARLARMNGSA